MEAIHPRLLLAVSPDYQIWGRELLPKIDWSAFAVGTVISRDPYAGPAAPRPNDFVLFYNRGPWVMELLSCTADDGTPVEILSVDPSMLRCVLPAPHRRRLQVTWSDAGGASPTPTAPESIP